MYLTVVEGLQSHCGTCDLQKSLRIPREILDSQNIVDPRPDLLNQKWPFTKISR